MGYADYLKALLRPLGVYKLDSGYGAAELCALGEVLDGINSASSELENECTVGTAVGYGLEAYEKILPQKPASIGTADRRKAIEALLSIDDACFTESALNMTLSGCGISAHVDETATANTVKITFPRTKSVPEKLEELQYRIWEILPCHLNGVYEYTFPAWGDVTDAAGTWQYFSDEELDWRGAERIE